MNQVANLLAKDILDFSVDSNRIFKIMKSLWCSFLSTNSFFTSFQMVLIEYERFFL